jgi:hypothetical protein
LSSIAPAKRQLREVSFRDDTIYAIPDDTGEIWVVVKQICESLGVGFGSQLQKLKDHHWSGVTMIVTPDARGREQSHSVIPLRALPMWLATIDVRKVGEGAREKLAAYQLEAADALHRHFFGRREPQPPAPDVDPLLAKARLLVETIERQVECERRLTAAELEVSALRAEAAAAHAKASVALATLTDDTRFMSLVGFAAERKLGLTRGELAAHGKKLSAHCRSEGIAVKSVPSEVWGHVNAYPVDLLDHWFAHGAN